MELGAEISEITLRRLVWRCLVCTDRFFFPSLPQIGSTVCCAWEEKKKNVLSNIKDVILLPSRAQDKSPLLWALLLLSHLTFIASQIIFPQTCHQSCLSGILPCPHLIKMFSPPFSPLLIVCALRKLWVFAAGLCVLFGHVRFFSSKASASCYIFHNICQIKLCLLEARTKKRKKMWFCLTCKYDVKGSGAGSIGLSFSE